MDMEYKENSNKLSMIIDNIKAKFGKENFGINFLIISLAVAGLLSIVAGAIFNKAMQKKNNVTYKVEVIQKRITEESSTTTPQLKEITVEVNVPLSVEVKDYIENIDEIDNETIDDYKLDTSLVNLGEAGTYTYTVTYKNKKYNGKIIVKEKELPIINNMTLKSINIELGSKLPTNITDYISETIPEDAKDKIVIDLSKVNVNMAGTYQYTVTYQDKIYTGEIKVYEAQPQIIEPNKDKTSEDTAKEEGKDSTNTTEEKAS